MSDQEKPYVPMTTEQAREWNAARKLRPLSESHWMVKAQRAKRLLVLANAWRRLVRKQHKQIRSLQDLVWEQEREITQLRFIRKAKK